MAVTTLEPANINVLIVEDEVDVADVLCHFFEQEGYSVTVAYDGEEALDSVNKDTHLILLDIMLPKLDGFQVCAALRSRAETEMIPIIFFSAKVEEEDQIRGLMAGGDDYLTKPVSPKVILAHARAVLRRSGVEESRTIKVGLLTIYEEEYRVSYDGEDLGVTLTEFELLRYLVRHPRKAFRRKHLLETICRDAMMVTERTVDAHIKNLREKLGPFAPHIQTVRGVGYRFVVDARADGGMEVNV